MFSHCPLRHPNNDKLRLFYEDTYRGYSVIQYKKSPLIENFLERSFFTLNLAQEKNRTTFAFRVDLHFPKAMKRSSIHNNNTVLTRFFRFFFYELKKANTKYVPSPRYLWAREQVGSEKPHYHLMLLLNKDAYDSLGVFSPGKDGTYSRQNLYHRMMRSWLKAMNFAADESCFKQLINVSKDHLTGRPWSSILNIENWYAMNDAMYMASYLCKTYSKIINQSTHVFDSSRR
ncbi:YagK/YfjJ domain-containing protein [Kushneria marisflavi]|uniref:YagK/YfjJ C-terminal domain-containing protein n=1 Tax=Kushneria marisflavi TaxID=157779 RepID=A0A240UPW0_9GAMM|nr:inovirus-type Gp2 protein [Kushneria marisflavi]ART63155.1 hypothetical protein B9H00_08880 [Kushneria marisflavi]RKD84587.1 uncharacterized protein DUF3296 [Kushneria marisflavi]